MLPQWFIVWTLWLFLYVGKKTHLLSLVSTLWAGAAAPISALNARLTLKLSGWNKVRVFCSLPVMPDHYRRHPRWKVLRFTSLLNPKDFRPKVNFQILMSRSHASAQEKRRMARKSLGSSCRILIYCWQNHDCAACSRDLPQQAGARPGSATATGCWFVLFLSSFGTKRNHYGAWGSYDGLNRITFYGQFA